MKEKFIFKLIIDMMMTILLLILMARQITGDTAHEWIGAWMFALWIIHNILNLRWYSHLLKGRYTPFRIIQTIVNMGIFLTMICLMVSGMILSRKVFAFLPIEGGIAIARPLHIISSYWGYVLMSAHLGLHWNMVIGAVRKALGGELVGKRLIALRVTGIVIATYGLYAFVKKQIITYLLMTSTFVFFDFEQSTILFFIDYMSIIGLFVFIAHYGGKWAQKYSGRKKYEKI